MATAEKNVEYRTFKGGVMSPTSKQTFAELRQHPPVIVTQKLIFDEDSFEQSFLKCSVCHERYNTTDKSPRLLPCHHSFCFSCILKCFEKESVHRQSLAPIGNTGMPYALAISCPSCSTPFITTEEGLKQLTADHRVIQLIDFIGHTDKQTVDYCTSHASQPLNFFCEACVKPICRDCTVIDHKKCSDGQMVFDINSAVQKYGPVLDNGIKEMEDEAKTLKEKRESCEDAIEKKKGSNTDVCKEIKDVFEKLRKALNEREQELLDMAEGQSGKGNDAIEEKIKLLKEKEALVKDNISSLQKAKADGKVTEMFSVHQKVREYKNEAPLTVSEVLANDQSKCAFSGQDESTLLSKISNFGDISISSSKTERGYSSSSSSPYANGYSGGVSRYSGLSDSSRYTGSSDTSRYTGSAYSSRYIPRTYRY